MANKPPEKIKDSFWAFAWAVARDWAALVALAAELIAIPWMFVAKEPPILALWLIQLGAALLFVAAAWNVYHADMLASQERERGLRNELDALKDVDAKRLNQARYRIQNLVTFATRARDDSTHRTVFKDWTGKAYLTLTSIIHADLTVPFAQSFIVSESEWGKNYNDPILVQRMIQKRIDALQSLLDTLDLSKLSPLFKAD